MDHREKKNVKKIFFLITKFLVSFKLANSTSLTKTAAAGIEVNGGEGGDGEGDGEEEGNGRGAKMLQ